MQRHMMTASLVSLALFGAVVAPRLLVATPSFPLWQPSNPPAVPYRQMPLMAIPEVSETREILAPPPAPPVALIPELSEPARVIPPVPVLELPPEPVENWDQCLACGRG